MEEPYKETDLYISKLLKEKYENGEIKNIEDLEREYEHCKQLLYEKIARFKIMMMIEDGKN